jgi:hypothetical protein
VGFGSVPKTYLRFVLSRLICAILLMFESNIVIQELMSVMVLRERKTSPGDGKGRRRHHFICSTI